MISREELIRSKEYWLEKIQNSLFVELEDYIEKNNLNKTKFADKLGVSKSYLSQVLNGNFDHKLSKLIELSLAIDKVPVIKFEEIDKCLMLDSIDKLSAVEDIYINIDFKYGFSIQNIYGQEKKTTIEDKNVTSYFHSYTELNKEGNKILA